MMTASSRHGPELILNYARPDLDPLALAQRALAVGFTGVGLADSPRIIPDCFIESERILAASDAGLVGPVIASLGLRHPVTVASAVRAMESHHPRRTLAIVGRGESSVINEGIAAPSLRDYRTRLSQLRELLLTDDGEDRLPGRLVGAASGPRTITVTSETLGAVLIDVGVEPESIDRAVQIARAADPDAQVWLFLRALVVSDEAHAAIEAGALIGSCAARLAAAPKWYGLTGDELAAAQRVAHRHDYRRHGTTQARREDATTDAASDERLVRERFVLMTDAADMVTRLQALRTHQLAGVVIAGGLPGIAAGVEELGRCLSTAFVDGGTSFRQEDAR